MSETKEKSIPKSVTKKEKTVRLALLGMFSAIIILLTCLPVKTLGLEISLAMIPIAIGATVLGPSGGAILGGVYGICSFLQCLGLLCPSPFGAALLAINPLLTFTTCFVPRVLCGVLAGATYKIMDKIQKFQLASHSASCLVCPLLNTVFFMSCIMIFFGKSDLIQGFMETLGTTNPLLFVIGFVGVNGLVEACVCFVIATAISRVLTSQMKRLK